MSSQTQPGDSPASNDGLTRKVSYDLEAVQSYMADVDRAKASLHEQIQAALARVEHANAYAASLSVIEEEAQRLEDEHRRALAAIAREADTEVRRILDSATAKAAALRTAMAATTQVGPETYPARTFDRESFSWSPGDRGAFNR